MDNTITPVCRNCHTMIGHVYPLYKKILREKIKSSNKNSNYKIDDFSSMNDVNMREELTAMNITNPCCVSIIMGFVSKVSIM